MYHLHRYGADLESTNQSLLTVPVNTVPAVKFSSSLVAMFVDQLFNSSWQNIN